MKVYVWMDIDHVSDRYHPEGSVVVVASSEEEALALVKQKVGPPMLGGEPVGPIELDLSVPSVWVFPDAGCC